MINKIELSGIHVSADEDIKKYARKKIAKLDGYMPKHARKSAHAEVKIEESTAKKAKGQKQYVAEVTIFVPGEVITAKETTVNMYAAIDIVEEKLKAQLRRYKSMTSGKRGAKIRRFLGKITRKK